MSYKVQEARFVPGKTRITYGAAIFEREERQAIEGVLDRNWWAFNGEGERFEEELAKFVGRRHCILTNSGSSALLLAIASLNLPSGSSVVIPAVTFPTAFNAIIQNRLMPFVVDADKTTLNIKLDEVEKAFKKGARAVIAVHIAGNPVDMKSLVSLGEKYKAMIVEDNCDGLGGEIEGKKVGSFGHLSCTSMYAGHIINMGEGGAVFCDDDNIARKTRSLRDWGRAGETDARSVDSNLPDDYPARYVYTEIGYNLRPLELQAAMGRVQLRKIHFIRKKREQNFNRLRKIFTNRKGITLIKQLPGSRPAWFSFPLLAEDRKSLITYLEKKNIETRPVFAGNILRQPAYRNVEVKKTSNLKDTDEVLNKALFIGLHPLIPNAAFDYIEKVVNQYFQE